MKSEKVEELASRWFARRHADRWTDDDQRTFDAWLEEHPAHRIAWIRLEAAWNEAARLKALGAGVPPGVIPPRGSCGSPRFSPPETPETPASVGTSRAVPRSGAQNGRQRRRNALLAITASVLLAISAGFYFHTIGLFAGNHYATQVGAVDTVPLPDGSRVMLNTDSRIRVALEAGERRVELERGEAFFEVAKDPMRPFIVEAGDKRVVAVGTQFSVRRDHNDIRVAVTEGKVRIENASTPLRAKAQRQEPSASDMGSAAVILTAGSVAQTANTEVLVHEAAGAEVSELLSWRTGYIVFRDISLADAVAEFNRYNVRKIVIADPAVAGIHIGGNFRANNADAFLWLLQSGFPVTVEQDDDQITLKRR